MLLRLKMHSKLFHASISYSESNERCARDSGRVALCVRYDSSLEHADTPGPVPT
jgi:hypothetical protein